MRRQDAAAVLGRLGAPVRWQEHTLRELLEWRTRAEAAEALRTEGGVTVDWRRLSLDRLLDMRVRATKAAEISAEFGVTVDWQLWTWVELEAMRRMLNRIGTHHGGEDGAARDRERRAGPRSTPPVKPAARPGAPFVDAAGADVHGPPGAAGQRSTTPTPSSSPPSRRCRARAAPSAIPTP